jgi:hypothetical protein
MGSMSSRCSLTSALTLGQELLDSPIISGSCVRVANRDRKTFKEFLAGSWPGVMRVGVAKNC